MVRRTRAAFVACLFTAATAAAAPVRLARHPDYHAGKITFSYLGDIWIANEDGSGVVRLTDNRAREIYPRSRPMADGSRSRRTAMATRTRDRRQRRRPQERQQHLQGCSGRWTTGAGDEPSHRQRRSQSNPSTVQTRYPGFTLVSDPSGFYQIGHIYREAPADKDYLKIKEGHFVVSLDDHELKAGENYWQYFTSCAGKKTQ